MKSNGRSKKYDRFSYIVCVIVFVICVSQPQPAFAGKLKDFEEDVKQPDKPKPPQEHAAADDDEPGFFASLFRGIFSGMFGALFGSNDAAGNAGQESIGFNGQPQHGALIPFFRLDADYQHVASDVQAFDARAEAGLYRLGLQSRFTYYYESDPADELTLIQLHGLWRMPLSQQVQISLGAGAAMLGGEEWNSGFSLTAPILIYPKESVGFEFRPSWSWIHGNTISDYDLGFVFSLSHTGLRLGYRWVNSPHESLNGPYFGVSFRF